MIPLVFCRISKEKTTKERKLFLFFCLRFSAPPQYSTSFSVRVSKNSRNRRKKPFFFFYSGPQLLNYLRLFLFHSNLTILALRFLIRAPLCFSNLIRNPFPFICLFLSERPQLKIKHGHSRRKRLPKFGVKPQEC